MIRSARLAAGGVGTVPWRLAASEQALAGDRAAPAAFEAAAAHAADGAEPLSHNAFKIELLRRTVRRALQVTMPDRPGIPSAASDPAAEGPRSLG